MSVLSRRFGQAAILAGLGAAGLFATAGTAFAHVVVDPHSAPQGAYARVSFRTPNEETGANTVKLEVSFPADHPIPSVLTEPVPGWTATVQKVTLPTPIQTDDGQVTEAVSTVTWSGGQIAPGQFQDFNVSLGALPKDTNQLVFKALQTYSNGEVVRWIDQTPPGGPEPEHPAPTLTLTPAAASDAAPTTAGSSGSLAVSLGIVGAVLGLVGAVLGGLALRRGSGTAGR
jgi:uncharacterized protein YcnI